MAEDIQVDYEHNMDTKKHKCVIFYASNVENYWAEFQRRQTSSAWNFLTFPLAI